VRGSDPLLPWYISGSFSVCAAPATDQAACLLQRLPGSPPPCASFLPKKQSRCCSCTASSNLVDDAYYSIPESVPVTLRYAQQLCDQDRYCVAGLAYFCGRLYCYPKPSTVTIREARVGETYNGINLYNMKRPGLSMGDVIEVQFDENSTMPVVNTTAAVLRVLNFSVPLGLDGTQFVGRWVNPSLLYVTIVAGGWDSGEATDPTLTRAGNLTFTVTPEANLR
jgi:hypothetical protein